MKTNFLPIALHNGQFIPFEDAKVSIATHALHYGTAAFGGMRGWVDEKSPHQTILFRLDEHTKRLSRSSIYLQADYSAHFFNKNITDFVKKNKPTKPFYIRPLVYISDLGISPRVHNAEKDFLIYGIELDDYLPSKGVSVCFSSWSRQPDSSLPLRGKISGAYITSSLAKSEAHYRGFDEAILLRNDGKVSEATGMNVFIVRDGSIITPGVEQDILEGITRASILKIANKLDIPVIQRPIDKSELYIADEVFLCGTAAKLTLVYKVESTTLAASHPIADRIKDVLDAISKGKNSDFKSWNTIITY
jgi:branched-chain amino acid aminotransferase